MPETRTLPDIASWLEDNERTQAWLARKAGVSPSHINLILKGERVPSDALIERIAQVIADNSCTGNNP